jgi:hypothetical protein
MRSIAASCVLSSCGGNFADVRSGLEAEASVCDCVNAASKAALHPLSATHTPEATGVGGQPGCENVCGSSGSGCIGCGDSQQPDPPDDGYETVRATYSTDLQSQAGDAAWCEKTSIVTVLYTSTIVISGSSKQATLPGPPEIPFETVQESASEYATQMPPYGSDVPDMLGAREAEMACYNRWTSDFPACAAVCYVHEMRAVGCDSVDSQCFCESIFGSDVLNRCFEAACAGSGGTIRAKMAASQGTPWALSSSTRPCHITNDVLACGCLAMDERELSDASGVGGRPNREQLLQAPLMYEANAMLQREKAMLQREKIEARDAADNLPCREDAQWSEDNMAARAGAKRAVSGSPDCESLAKEVVPTCAQNCYLAIASDVGCELLDFDCQCRPDIQAALTPLMMPCVLTDCGMGEIMSVIAGGSSGKSNDPSQS